MPLLYQYGGEANTFSHNNTDEMFALWNFLLNFADLVEQSLQ